VIAPSQAPSVATLLDLSGHVAVITGASGGIGSSIAARLHEAGASVVVHAHTHLDRAQALVDHLGDVARLGGRATAVAVDLARSGGAASLAESALEAFGRLDIWVNNAGLQPVQALLDQSDAEFDDVMRANVNATFAGTQAAAKAMRSGGSIVNIASIEGLQPARGHSHYTASKAAVLAHTKAAASELGPLGVRVNAVAPGLIERDGLQHDWPEGVARWHAACPLGRLGRGDDIADAVLYLASPMARWVTGATLGGDGGVLTGNTW
jgi:NAD(P)-dependent dehydrogenase (short-subunit alcohol dehydrogenase family)